jgi:predicted alpha/beta superfamily hydrolase
MSPSERGPIQMTGPRKVRAFAILRCETGGGRVGPLPVFQSFDGQYRARSADETSRWSHETVNIAPCSPSDPRYSFEGADAFLRFLLTELKPAIEQRYPVDATDSTIVGSSFGGLFASWVLLTQPGAFQRFVLCSPALWWNGEKVWEWITQFTAARTESG